MLNYLLAQKPWDFGGTLEGIGPLGIFNVTQDSAVSIFNLVVRNIIGFLTIIAGLWFIFQILIGGISWLTAGADKQAVEGAQKRITQSVIGLVIVVVSIFVIDLIGKLLGLDILQPSQFILSIWTI